jgi:hypothetical protein
LTARDTHIVAACWRNGAGATYVTRSSPDPRGFARSARIAPTRAIINALSDTACHIVDAICDGAAFEFDVGSKKPISFSG